eukprot:7535447-Alexandrium_andersonii.AAC.1
MGVQQQTCQRPAGDPGKLSQRAIATHLSMRAALRAPFATDARLVGLDGFSGASPKQGSARGPKLPGRSAPAPLGSSPGPTAA